MAQFVKNFIINRNTAHWWQFIPRNRQRNGLQISKENRLAV